jgi:hypothetical protein
MPRRRARTSLPVALLISLLYVLLLALGAVLVAVAGWSAIVATAELTNLIVQTWLVAAVWRDYARARRNVRPGRRPYAAAMPVPVGCHTVPSPGSARRARRWRSPGG